MFTASYLYQTNAVYITHNHTYVEKHILLYFTTLDYILLHTDRPILILLCMSYVLMQALYIYIYMCMYIYIDNIYIYIYIYIY